MNKLLLMDIFMQARLRASRREQVIAYQRSVMSKLDSEGINTAESRRLLSALTDARDRDFDEMDWALNELDKTAERVPGQDYCQSNRRA
jgi:hypothetical protein